MKQYGVLGLGRFGKSVARTLYELGNEVIVVDINESNINEMGDDVTYAVIGDSTKEQVLRAAGIKEVDVVIIAITDFETSILTALQCLDIGVKKIISKARNDVHRDILSKIGVHEIVVPEKDMGRKLAHNIVNKNVIESISLSNNFEIIEISVPESWVGYTIGQIDVRKKYGINILGISRGKSDFIGNPSTKTDLKYDDKLLLLGTTAQISSLQDID